MRVRRWTVWSGCGGGRRESLTEELKDVIRRRHGAEATHVEGVAIKEEFQGRTVWEGVVEVFDLKDHRGAGRVYA